MITTEHYVAVPEAGGVYALYVREPRMPNGRLNNPFNVARDEAHARGWLRNLEWAYAQPGFDVVGKPAALKRREYNNMRRPGYHRKDGRGFLR